MRSFGILPVCMAAGLFAATGLQSSEARACGGFFCSQANPVNQTDEHIVFAHNDDGTVTAIIEIQYQGPSESFAWLLPVPGVPDVGVSSNRAITMMRSLTDPQYTLDRRIEGECMPEPIVTYGYDDALTAAPGAGDAMSATTNEQETVPVVVVEGQGNVGPYDWVVISVNPDADDRVEEAVDWLTENEYDVTAIGPDVLRPYLDDGLNFLAFKLTKGNAAGAIRPVMITYESSQPMIPIRPTAVAADPDMGVLTWVLSDTQAIPNNYYSLVLNEATINWFNYRQNYQAVISAAADEAGGQGFVTEFAGSSDRLNQTLFTTADETNWETFSTTDHASGYAAIEAAQIYYRAWDGWRDAIAAATTLPEGVTLDEFGRNPTAYRDDPALIIDEELFVESVRTLVVEPMQKTQEVVDSLPYVTRLYTTMSPEEMTVDPSFDFNPDLADVNNVHRATQVTFCNKDVYVYQAPFVIEIPGVGTIDGDPNTVGVWPIEIGADMPATRKIVSLSTSGAGEVAVDNSEDIWGALGTEVVAVDPEEMMGQESEDAQPIGGNDMMVAVVEATDPGGDGSTTSTTDDPEADNEESEGSDGVSAMTEAEMDGLMGEGSESSSGETGDVMTDADAPRVGGSGGACSVSLPTGGAPVPWGLGFALGFVGLALRRRPNA